MAVGSDFGVSIHLSNCVSLGRGPVIKTTEPVRVFRDDSCPRKTEAHLLNVMSAAQIPLGIIMRMCCLAVSTSNAALARLKVAEAGLRAARTKVQLAFTEEQVAEEQVDEAKKQLQEVHYAALIGLKEAGAQKQMQEIHCHAALARLKAAELDLRAAETKVPVALTVVQVAEQQAVAAQKQVQEVYGGRSDTRRQLGDPLR
ncbi:hypothetical protein EIP86_006308 [Pleurotus ostreatoroseus]|nr:hypothetical protein EIP86_006308 [Pleurotus ostreatoroseus]